MDLTSASVDCGRKCFLREIPHRLGACCLRRECRFKLKLLQKRLGGFIFCLGNQSFQGQYAINAFLPLAKYLHLATLSECENATRGKAMITMIKSALMRQTYLQPWDLDNGCMRFWSPDTGEPAQPEESVLALFVSPCHYLRAHTKGNQISKSLYY